MNAYNKLCTAKWREPADNFTNLRFRLSVTTVLVDTRLWKTKHLRKRFQNFRQSYVL